MASGRVGTTVISSVVNRLLAALDFWGLAVREYVHESASSEPMDVDEIELTVEHFEQALEEIEAGVDEGRNIRAA